MTPLEVLRALRARGIEVVLWPNDTLHCQSEAGLLTPDLVAAMRQHKEALLTILEWYEERCGLLEFDGGMSRPAAEREAWRCVEERWGTPHT
jgi:hypothetical protein